MQHTSILSKLDKIDTMLTQKTEQEIRQKTLLCAVHTAHICIPPCTVCAMLCNDVPAAAARCNGHSDKFWRIWPSVLRWLVLLVIGVQLVKAVLMLDLYSAIFCAALLSAYTAGKYSGGERFP